MTITPQLIGFIQGYLSVMELRSDVPEDVQEKTKELSERIRMEVLDEPK